MKQYFKKLFSKYPYVYNLLSFTYHFRKKYWQPRRFNDLHVLLSTYSRQKKDVFFIQVGSNDGVSNDPLNSFINQFNWKGVCIEPIPMNFDKLKLTYKDKAGIQLVNAAVGDESKKKIYYINPEKAQKFNVALPEWYSQLASFDRDLVIGDLVGERKSEILEELEIKCISFEKIFTDYKIEELELLHIDCEGADWMILSSFPFHKSIPEIIVFEHNHLSLSEYKKAVVLLTKYRYSLLKVDTDTFCYREEFYSVFNNAREKSRFLVP